MSEHGVEPWHPVRPVRLWLDVISKTGPTQIRANQVEATSPGRGCSGPLGQAGGGRHDCRVVALTGFSVEAISPCPGCSGPLGQVVASSAECWTL